MMAVQENIALTTALGPGPWRDGLQRAQLQNAKLDFVDVSPIHRAFAPMAREQKFDISEMAIVTALQAVAYNKPLLIFPVTVAARFQHNCLITRKSETQLKASDLAGRRVGVRAYTQTTGVWIRGILQNDYGVPCDLIRWVTQEGAHLAEYQDPPWVERVASDRSLPDMLRAEEIDAAILGNDLPDSPDFAPVIPDPHAAARVWYRKHTVVPINHMIAVREDVARAQPKAIREFWRALSLAKPPAADGPDMAAFGISANRAALALMLSYCEPQKLLPRPLAVDDIFAGTIALLGEEAYKLIVVATGSPWRQNMRWIAGSAGNFLRRASIMLTLSAALFQIVSNASPVRAASYPERPVKIIVPYGAGGIADVTLRLVAQKLSEKFGQQFVIENRPWAPPASSASTPSSHRRRTATR